MASLEVRLEESDIFQFVDELFRSLLPYRGIKYNAVKVYSKSIDYVNWPTVLHSIGVVFKGISNDYHEHLSEVVCGLHKVGKWDVYIYSLGKYLFGRIDFSWSLFMAFIAHMMSLATLAYQRGITFLSDKSVACIATYIKNYLRHHMLNLGGWKAFEQYCVSSIFKPAKKPGPTSKSGKSTTQAAAEASRSVPNPHRILLVKQPIHCFFANHTFGRSYTACDVQIFKEPYVENGGEGCDPQVMFSLLEDDKADKDSICSLCCNSPSGADKFGSYRVESVIPRKRCIPFLHVVIVSAWVLNAMQPDIQCQMRISFS